MTPSQTTELLKARSGYTSQPYSESIAQQWHEALEWAEFTLARQALASAARESSQISLADVLARIPGRRPEEANSTPVGTHPCGCGTVTADHKRIICDEHRAVGLAAIARIRAERQSTP